MKKLVATLVLCIPALWVHGEGYQVNLQGSRQIGMGHTGTGLYNGSSGIHFNPGSLGFMDKKMEFSMGVSTIFGKNTFQKEFPSTYVAKSDNPVGTPLYFYGAGKIGEKLVIGLGITTPYGNSLKWDENWDGRYLIQDISLKAFYIQPTVAYRLTEKLSLGAGFVLATGDVVLHKALPLADSQEEGQVELDGSTMNYGYNVGVFFKASEKLSLGIDYRSEIMMKVDGGKANFTVPASMQANFPANNTFSAELPMPANLVFGVGFKPNDKLTLAVDLQYVFWSTYESLNFDFENNTATLQDSENIRNFENTMVYRFGAEYLVSSKLTGRIGFAYDNTPIPENYLTPETPGNDKLNFSAGLSYQVTDRLSFDASFLFIKALERKDGYAPADFYGTYNTTAVIPGFGINYSF